MPHLFFLPSWRIGAMPLESLVDPFRWICQSGTPRNGGSDCSFALKCFRGPLELEFAKASLPVGSGIFLPYLGLPVEETPILKREFR